MCTQLSSGLEWKTDLIGLQSVCFPGLCICGPEIMFRTGSALSAGFTLTVGELLYAYRMVLS